MEKRVLLCILDGWGLPKSEDVSAITPHTAPFFHHLQETFQSAALEASGTHVGLPDGVQGNSEVGHATIGLGDTQLSPHSIVSQHLEDGSLEASSNWMNFIQTIQQRNSAVHILTLLSTGYIHADLHHLISTAHILHKHNIKVKIHAILDGRDCPAGSAHDHIKTLLNKAPFVEIVTITGRERCMDRGNNWQYTLATYQTIIHGHNPQFTHPLDFITPDFCSDECLPPSSAHHHTGFDYSTDTFLFLNFRSDRMVQIVSALCDPNYTTAQPPNPSNQHWKSIVPYKRTHTISHLIPHAPARQALGHTLIDHNISQARISESEKLFHVTYFFDGRNKIDHPLISSLITPSFPNPSLPYDPNIPTNTTAHNIIKTIQGPAPNFILVNFAASDLLGHTGDIWHAKQGVSCVDNALAHITQVAWENDYIPIITADHGNAECMEKGGKAHTGHSCNPVPLLILSHHYKMKYTQGELKDVAPTVLDIFDINPPTNMTGRTLLNQ